MASLDSSAGQNRDHDQPSQTSQAGQNTSPLIFDGFRAPSPQTTPQRGDLAANDRTIGGRPPTDAPWDGSSLTAAQLTFLDKWQQTEPVIRAFNAKHDADGGSRMQTAVFQYTRASLKQMGLDRAGWDVYQVAMNSPLDKIGADIVLVNSRSGAMVFLDPTSRRLDAQTGEYAPDTHYAQKRAPSIREAGVVDVLPKWFDRTTGNLIVNQDEPEMRERVLEFKDNFAHQIRDLTTQPAPFNYKDFPLPYMGTAPIDAKTSAAQIQAVVDWAQKAAETSRKSGDFARSHQQQEFARVLTSGALNYVKRTDSESLQNAMEHSVDKVIVDEALHRAYPQYAKADGGSPRAFQVLTGGGDIKVDKNRELVVNLVTPGKPGENQVVSAGSVTDSFQRRTGYWLGGISDKGRQAELMALLPKSMRKEVDAGHIKVERILAQISSDRNAFAGGGAGVDKPLIGRVVMRLAQKSSQGLRDILNGAHDQVTVPSRVESGSHLGRPQAGSNGAGGAETRWQAGEAPKPQAGKIDLPPSRGAEALEKTEPLTAEEVKELDRARIALESKGAAALNKEDREQIASLKYAATELTKPLDGDRGKIELVRHIRGLVGSEARGAALSVAMLSVAVLNWYNGSRDNSESPDRSKFY